MEDTHDVTKISTEYHGEFTVLGTSSEPDVPSDRYFVVDGADVKVAGPFFTVEFAAVIMMDFVTGLRKATGSVALGEGS